jgi:hypothetical protein
MLAKRSLVTGQRWLRELATEAESKKVIVQHHSQWEAAFYRGQAVAYSRAAYLIGEYFRSPERKPRAEPAPTCLELPFCGDMDCRC